MNKNGIWQAMNLVSALGLTIVSTVAVGLFLGRWWDEQFATFPWGTTLGILLGVAAGCVGIFKLIIGSQKN